MQKKYDMAPSFYYIVPGIPDNLLFRAQTFANELPESQGVQREKNKLVFTYIINEQVPTDSAKYRNENVNRYAVKAYEKIFYDQDKIDLLFKGIKIVFVVLFFDGNNITDIEFTYFINDELFN
jgi:hypothetical protein